MNQKNKSSYTPRESFLFSLLNKVIKEYKVLLEHSRSYKPLKIVEILSISSIPGESRFTIQITNKNSIAKLSAAEIINAGYNLNDFSDYHAHIISHAAQGKLDEFLKLSEKEPLYKISSKKFDATKNQYMFTIETKDNIRFIRTADELSYNKDVLLNMSKHDVYDIGYTKGSESIINEKLFLDMTKI